MSIELLVTGLLTITGLIVGWSLNELSTWLKMRRDDRTAVGNIIVALAEIRFRMTVTHAYVDRVKASFPISREDALHMHQFFDHLLTSLDVLTERYDQALYHLAGRNPDLAFRLNSKNLAPTLLRRLRDLAARDSTITEQYEKFEDYLVERILPDLDTVILELSDEHGGSTKARYLKRVENWNNKDAMNKEVDEFLAELNMLTSSD